MLFEGCSATRLTAPWEMPALACGPGLLLACWAGWAASGGAARCLGVGGQLSSEQKGLRSGAALVPLTLG